MVPEAACVVAGDDRLFPDNKDFDAAVVVALVLGVDLLLPGGGGAGGGGMTPADVVLVLAWFGIVGADGF